MLNGLNFSWHWSPITLIGLVILCLLYAGGIRFARRHNAHVTLKGYRVMAFIAAILAACRRERMGSHASRSGSACVMHGTGTGARTACGRKRNRVSNSDPTNWKDAPIPTLRSG